MNRKMKEQTPNLDPTRIINTASAFYDSCALFTASDLGVFGKLAELGEADTEKIASECGLNNRGTRLLLDSCVALGLLHKTGQVYRNSEEVNTFLVPGSPADLSKAIRYNRDVYGAWGRLNELVKTGKPVERPEIHLGEDADRTRTFVLSMHGRALGIGRAVVPQLDLVGRKQLFDVGGGPGTYSVLIAKANPDIECTVLDLPEVVKVAAELIEAESMQDRVKTLPGDYHKAAFPGENDVVNFFGVLHQESPDDIRDLFARAYESLVPGGLIHVLDMMTDAGHTQPKFSAMFAVNMALTSENGWVFSDEELAGWLAGAGFVDFACRPLPPPMPHWLATAHKPG
jgi:SAM-dependent methyltransferase